jgi:hypothetical protein
MERSLLWMRMCVRDPDPVLPACPLLRRLQGKADVIGQAKIDAVDPERNVTPATSARPSQYEVTAPTHATSNGQSPKWLKWRSVRNGPHPPIPCQ